ncbi:MAG: hypothetical protein ACKO9V_09660 [Candidatus Kapaibacterium sp.]
MAPVRVTTILRISLVALFMTATLRAQNNDGFSERMGDDFLLLRAMHGMAPVGSYAVIPLRLATSRALHEDAGITTVRELRTELHSAYRPLLERPSTEKEWITLAGKRDPRLHAFVFADSLVRLQCDISAMLRSGSTHAGDGSEAFLLGNMTARAMGSLGGNLGFLLYLSNGVLLSGDPDKVRETDPLLARTLKFTSVEKKYFDRYLGYVQYQSEQMNVRIGRDVFATGYSPIDNLVHSRYASLMDGVLLDIPYRSIRFTSIHAAVDGTNADGSAITNKFISSHRVQVDPASWLSFSVHDMIAYSERGIDLAYLNPLAFYVSTGLTNQYKSDFDNSLLGIDAAIRPWERTILYGALLLDDLAFTSLRDTTATGNNNKSIWQLGASHDLSPGGRSLLVSAEYVRCNPFVYSHRQIRNSWTHAGAPLGYDIQPNSDRIAVQTKWWISGRNFFEVNADYTRWGENLLDRTGDILKQTYVTAMGDTVHVPVGNVGGDMLRGDADFLPEPFSVGNAFLRGNISTTRRIRMWLSTEVMTNVFIDSRALYQHRSGGNSPGERWWFSVELRVGY